MELAVLDYQTILWHLSSSLSSHLLGEGMSRRNGGDRRDMFLNPQLRRRGPHSTAEIVAENSVESRRYAVHGVGLCPRQEIRVRDDSSLMRTEEVLSNRSNNKEPEGLFSHIDDGGLDTSFESEAKSEGGPVDMFLNRKLRRRGPHSMAEIVAENVVESRRHAAHDGELRPVQELRVRGNSSSMRAEDVVSYGSNNAKQDVFVSEFCDGGLDTSFKPEAATFAREREFFVAEVMASLGPFGPGLLAVRGVPEVAELRKKLLPLAKKLALMPDDIRRPVLKNYGLSTDVPLKKPDRPVSAFATKLEYTSHSHATDGSCISSPLSKSSPGCLCDVSNSKDLSNATTSRDLSSGSGNLLSELERDVQHLGSIVRQLGASMVEIGLLVARLCDSAIPEAHLEDAIWESGSAKARLIHYHAYSENKILAKASKVGKGFTQNGASRKLSKTKEEFESDVEEIFKEIAEAVQTASAGSNPPTAPHNLARVPEELWQDWHYDYGILTVLTAPMFLSSSPAITSGERESECSPGGHTGLRILSRGLDNFVRVPADCLIVQVGEAAQIASGGKLAAVAHCVARPPNGDAISREMFVTFLQPAWDRVLRPPIGTTTAEVLNVELLNREPNESKDENFLSHEGSRARTNTFSEQYAKLSSVVPSLESRWKEGCTFAEFSRETTAQYYGARGRQSRRTG